MANGESDSDAQISEEIGDAVEALEESAVDTFSACVKSGDIEGAERAAAAAVEGMRRAVADVHDAAESVQQVAEETAANAPEEAAEEAEEAVDSAQEAVEAAEDAEEEIREEQREQGGSEVTEDTAIDQAIHEEAEEAVELTPPEAQPAIEMDEEIAQEVADVTDDKPALISPQAEHPYYRRRKLFGRFTI